MWSFQDQGWTTGQGSGNTLAVAWSVTAAGVIIGSITGATAGSDEATEPGLDTIADEADVNDEEVEDTPVEDETVDTDSPGETETTEEGTAVSEGADDERVEDDDNHEDAAAETENEESESSPGWISSSFGDFQSLQESGAGDSVVSLPDDAHAGMITADGPWNIEVLPYTEAEDLSDSSVGDGVFIHDGDSGVLEATHDGQSNFVVREEADQLFSSGLLINEIGSYQGSVPVQAGPSIFIVEADGNWTVNID